MKSEEVKNKVCMHWSSGFFKKSQCNYVHIIEDCLIHLRGIHEGIANVETNRDTGTDRDIQRQTGTDRDRQGQVRKSMSEKNVPVCPCLSLPCRCLSLLVPACPCAVPGIDWHNWEIARDL